MSRMKSRRRLTAEPTLNLTSMMDIFTIILVFLLRSFAEATAPVSASPDLRLPVSSSKESMAAVVSLVLSRDAILVDGLAVVDLNRRPDPDREGAELSVIPPEELSGNSIPRLSARLKEKRRSPDRPSADGPPGGAAVAPTRHGRVLLQVDRDIPFSMVRQVMFTAGQAGFDQFSFAVYHSR